MAQKKQVSKPQGSTHGLVSDPDPRFQIKGSYTDALNIRLTNDTGDTFTVENIKGNTLLIDLFGVQFQSYIDAVGVSSGILGTRPDIKNDANVTKLEDDVKWMKSKGYLKEFVEGEVQQAPTSGNALGNL